MVNDFRGQSWWGTGCLHLSGSWVRILHLGHSTVLLAWDAHKVPEWFIGNSCSLSHLWGPGETQPRVHLTRLIRLMINCPSAGEETWAFPSSFSKGNKSYGKMGYNITTKYISTSHSKTNAGAHFTFGIKVMEKRNTNFVSTLLGSWLKAPPIIKDRLTGEQQTGLYWHVYLLYARRDPGKLSNSPQGMAQATTLITIPS